MAKKDDASKKVPATKAPKKVSPARVVKKTTKSKKTNKVEDSSQQVAIDVRELTEQDAENMLDKIIAGSKGKKTINSKYHINSKFYQASKSVDKPSELAAVKPTVQERREAERHKKATARARLLKREANRQAAEIKKIAERQAEEIRLIAERQAADIKMKASAKADRISHKTNKKAIKRELKATIRQAKLEAAIKLGKTSKVQPKQEPVVRKARTVKVDDKPKFPKIIRNTLMATVVISVIVFGAGFIYTWYIGQSEVVEAVADKASSSGYEKPIIKATPPADGAKVGVSIQFLSSPARRGEEVVATAKTLAKANCFIAVKYNEVNSRAAGLGVKAADEFGIVSWTWTVDSSAPNGKWPVEITCTRKAQSGFVRGEIEILR